MSIPRERLQTSYAELDPYDLTELPQRRCRLFMVGLSTKHFDNGKFNFPREMNKTPKDIKKYIDFRGEKEDSYYLPTDNRYYKMIDSKLDDPFCIYQLRKFLVRVKNPNECPTLTANMGQGGHNVPFIYDKKGLRKLTEQECLNLQGFSSEFSFPEDVPRAKRYVQVGNAVCPPIAKLLANKITELLCGVQ